MLDFFSKQEAAHRKTKLLVFYFIICVILIILGVFIAVYLFVFFLDKNPTENSLPARWWSLEHFIWVSIVTSVIVSVASLLKIQSLASGGAKVATLLGGKKISPNTNDLKERKALNVVEEMAIASGVPVPPVFLLKDEKGINAFAAGFSPTKAVIGVTQGCLDCLSRDELQGVIAHEFSHILNGDMRLNIKLMGFIFGILVLTIVGRFLIRTRGKKNPLPILGLLLLILGYIGVFFGRLIKAAVSRQREFLADASAVQFTRNPDGISNALKKIGRIASGSKIKHPRAEEASHLYFADGLLKKWSGWFSTHPPLTIRIQQLDPTFKGKFSKISYQKLSQAEEERLAKAIEIPKGRFSISPTSVIEKVGAPQLEHLLFAKTLIATLPTTLTNRIRDSFCARGIIYALLLSHDSETEKTQINWLKEEADPEVFKKTEEITPSLRRLGPEARLPLIDMAIPALEELPPNEYSIFRSNIRRLVDADNKLDLFEFTLEQILTRRLDPHFRKVESIKVRYNTFYRLKKESAALLSCLAHFGNESDEMAQIAFEKGMEKIPFEGEKPKILARKDTNLNVLDKALDQLTQISPKMKRSLLEACSTCIAADRLVSVEEAETLRAISEALDCPLPPFVSVRKSQ